MNTPQNINSLAEAKADSVQEAFDKLGLTLPEMVTSSTDGMRAVARFLLEHRVFDMEQDEILRSIQGANE